MTPETLSCATASHRGANGLTAAEIGGALAGLSGDATMLAWWKYMGSELDCVCLQSSARSVARRVAIENKWVLGPKNAPIIERIGVLCLHDAVDPNICPECNQRAALQKACKVCGGLGVVRPKAFWRKVDVSVSSWEKTWKARYKEIDAEIKSWVNGLDSSIRAVLSRE